VKANQLVDSTGAAFLLRGVVMPGLEAIAPTAADLANVRAMNGFTFRVIQQRWNMNAVRLPVSAAVWKRDGKAYLDRIAAIVALAHGEGLVAVLAHGGRAVGRRGYGSPSAGLVDFEGVRGRVCTIAARDLRAVQRAFDAQHSGEQFGGTRGTARWTGRCGATADALWDLRGGDAVVTAIRAMARSN
jgi:hypothetical protein